MVDTARPGLGVPGRDAAPLPDRSVVPPVWGRITNLLVERGEGSWLVTTRRRALPRLFVGHRRHEHGPRPSARRRGHPGTGGEAPPRPAEHHVPRARPAALRPVLAAAARRRLGRVPLELRRRGDRGIDQARPRSSTGRPVILGFRYGYHGRTGPDDGADDARRTSIAATSSRCRAPSTTPRIRTATAPRAAPTRPTPAPATGKRSST